MILATVIVLTLILLAAVERFCGIFLIPIPIIDKCRGKRTFRGKVIGAIPKGFIGTRVRIEYPMYIGSKMDKIPMYQDIYYRGSVGLPEKGDFVQVTVDIFYFYRQGTYIYFAE